MTTRELEASGGRASMVVLPSMLGLVLTLSCMVPGRSRALPSATGRHCLR
jgi:hypothetical protein